MSPTTSLSSSVDTAEYRIILLEEFLLFSPALKVKLDRWGGVLPSFFESKSVEKVASPYKLALNVELFDSDSGIGVLHSFFR